MKTLNAIDRANFEGLLCPEVEKVPVCDEVGDKSPFGQEQPGFRSGSKTIPKVKSGIGRFEIWKGGHSRIIQD